MAKMIMGIDGEGSNFKRIIKQFKHSMHNHDNAAKKEKIKPFYRRKNSTKQLFHKTMKEQRLTLEAHSPSIVKGSSNIYSKLPSKSITKSNDGSATKTKKA